MKSEEMEEERINGAQRELVRDDTEPPRGQCESIVHPQSPDGNVEVSCNTYPWYGLTVASLLLFCSPLGRCSYLYVPI